MLCILPQCRSSVPNLVNKLLQEWSINEAAPEALNGPFNVLLGRHVMHQATDLTASIAHIKTALLPGGFLLLQASLLHAKC